MRPAVALLEVTTKPALPSPPLADGRLASSNSGGKSPLARARGRRQEAGRRAGRGHTAPQDPANGGAQGAIGLLHVMPGLEWPWNTAPLSPHACGVALTPQAQLEARTTARDRPAPARIDGRPDSCHVEVEHL
jgi:hypothetical protein